MIYVSAENGALPGGKVGGIGDVIRELPAAVTAAVTAAGYRSTVVTPSYGSFHLLPGARKVDQVTVDFRGDQFLVKIFNVPGQRTEVENLVFDHELFQPTVAGMIYHDDESDHPYGTDADKFSFFCAAVAAWLKQLETPPTAVHLHDWHVAMLLVLRKYHCGFKALRKIPVFFTIHNLSYQGQRPFKNADSSLESWFPNLDYKAKDICDPVHKHVFNPLATAIRWADRINTVSPTYAIEIQKPSDPSAGFIGGEHLERDLQNRAARGELVGILNGCDYASEPVPEQDWQDFLNQCCEVIENYGPRKVDLQALATLQKMPRNRPAHVLVSIGRIVDQKMQLFFAEANNGESALQNILTDLGDKGVVLILGSGERRYEEQLEKIAASNENMVFINGYSEPLGNALYATGDLFLMPSSFEPCGISQMIAMREGQPCVVHGIGGLADTVMHEVNGFVFNGNTKTEQAKGFVDCVSHALNTRSKHVAKWRQIVSRARAARFEWSTAASAYIREFYEYAD